jgi:PTH2 family peptidyl-tRNA hydrolase
MKNKREVKQVIIIRKDLKMNAGKLAAQASHASISFLVDRFIKKDKLTEAETIWVEEKFTKICLKVNSEEELLRIYQSAKSQNLECVLITDAGLTEFHGVPTKTCIAIGPDFSDKIDKITNNLKLY